MIDEVKEYLQETFCIVDGDINFVNLTYDVKDYLEALEKHMQVAKQRSILELFAKTKEMTLDEYETAIENG